MGIDHGESLVFRDDLFCLCAVSSCLVYVLLFVLFSFHSRSHYRLLDLPCLPRIRVLLSQRIDQSLGSLLLGDLIIIDYRGFN